MTRYTLLLLLFCLAGPLKAQWLSSNPPGPEFCTIQAVTYTYIPSNPNNTINWYVDDYLQFSWTGAANTTSAGTGPVLTIQPFQYGTGFFVWVEETDSNNAVVWQTYEKAVFHSTDPIPVYFSNGGCGFLEAAIPFETTLGGPGWSMWYRDGLPTGWTQGYLYGPLPGGTYEYKLKMSCSPDTLSSNPIQMNGFTAPQVLPSGSTTFCDGDSVVLALQPGQPSFYVWNWLKDGVGIPGTGGMYSYTAKTSGNYKVQVHSTSSGGCFQSSYPIPVTVTPAAIITAPNVACSSDTVTLSCTPASSYQWKRYGTDIPGATSQTLQVTLSGNYQVITTGLACDTSDVHNLQFYARPSGIAISQSGPIPLCKSESMALTMTGNNITSWNWLRNGVSMPGGNTPTIIVTKPGNYKCIVSNAIGCSKTSAVAKLTTPAAIELPSKSVTLKLNPSATDSYTTCAFGNFGTNFANTTSLEVSAWYKHFRTAERAYLKFDLSTIPEQSPIVSATLKLYADTSVVYQNGIQSLQVKRITEDWMENTISWNIAPDSSVFQSSSIPVTAAQSNTTVSVSVTDIVRHWSFLPAENFGFIVHLEDNTPLSFPTGWMSFYSGDHPTAASRPKLTVKYSYADITENGPLTFCASGSVMFSTNPGYNYQWYENNIAIPGANASTYTATISGNYYVILSNAAGCTVQSATKTVTVPCREGKFDNAEIVIIHEQSSDEIKVILPANEGLISLYDMTGRLISSYDCRERECVFVNSNLSPGVYMVHVVSPGAIRSKKLLIE